ncbi:hypothetical protein WG954_21490 [Lacibacter sp. H375]|uniref:hypothetical protein n=1 Tax=Lacibacter sp. H375 TaxID=3133424 RepID=UPI0030BF4F9E
MNKLILSSSVLLLLSACSKITPVKEIAVSKTVEFSVYQAVDYSAPVYNGVEAEVRLTLGKQTSNGSEVILWDTVIPYQSLRAYPAIQTPLRINKQFDILQNSEQLRFGKVIRYRDALNQVSFVAIGEDIPPSVNVKVIQVDL